jgi:hypothetical protein
MIINGINWTDDDIKTVERFIEIKNKGYYADGRQVTDFYNRLLGKHVNPTNCGSCIRQRVGELENALNHARELERQAAEKKVAEEPKKTKTKKKEE